MTDEPRRHRLFMICLALAILGSVPFAFVGRAPTPVLGLPVWLWSSIFFTVALAVLTAWGFVRYWKDDADD
jgi:hypothetical protein